MERLTLIKSTRFIIITLALCLGATMVHAQVVVVVSPQNQITTLRKAQISDIFLGNSRLFPDGNNATPIDQTEGRTVRDEFYLNIMSKSPAQIKAYWAKIIFTGRGDPPREVSNSAELKKLIARNPHAIGYIEQSQVDDSVKVIHIP